MINENLLKDIRVLLDEAKKEDKEGNLHFIFMGCMGKYGDSVPVTISNAGNIPVLMALMATAMEDNPQFSRVVFGAIVEYANRMKEGGCVCQ